MTPSKMRWLLLAVVLAGCGDKAAKPPKLSEALPNIPLPPNPTFVQRAGGTDALQITVSTPASAESLAVYYRRVLSQGRWKLINDSKDVSGAVTLMAQQDGPPLWVRIRPAAGAAGSLVDLFGAVVPKTDAAAPAKPTS